MKRKGPEKIFEEIIVENFPNMGKGTVIHVQEAHGVPYRINPRRSILKKILIKLIKIKHKEKILKSNNNSKTYNRIPIRLSAYFFSRNSAGQKGVAGYI